MRLELAVLFFSIGLTFRDKSERPLFVTSVEMTINPTEARVSAYIRVVIISPAWRLKNSKNIAAVIDSSNKRPLAFHRRSQLPEARSMR
jgi:hypothetical protein